MKIQDIKEGYYITDATIKSLTWEQWEQFFDEVICNVVDRAFHDKVTYYYERQMYTSAFRNVGGVGVFGPAPHSKQEVCVSKQDILNMLQELNEQQGYDNNAPFTIDMLKPGMFCKQRNGVIWIVVEGGEFIGLTDCPGYSGDISEYYDENLVYNDGFSVDEQYDVVSISITYDFASPIWERKEEGLAVLVPPAYGQQEQAACLEERVALLEAQLQKMTQMVKEKELTQLSDTVEWAHAGTESSKDC